MHFYSRPYQFHVVVSHLLTARSTITRNWKKSNASNPSEISETVQTTFTNECLLAIKNYQLPLLLWKQNPWLQWYAKSWILSLSIILSSFSLDKLLHVFTCLFTCWFLSYLFTICLLVLFFHLNVLVNTYSVMHCYIFI